MSVLIFSLCAFFIFFFFIIIFFFYYYYYCVYPAPPRSTIIGTAVTAGDNSDCTCSVVVPIRNPIGARP